MGSNAWENIKTKVYTKHFALCFVIPSYLHWSSTTYLQNVEEAESTCYKWLGRRKFLTQTIGTGNIKSEHNWGEVLIKHATSYLYYIMPCISFSQKDKKMVEIFKNKAIFASKKEETSLWRRSELSSLLTTCITCLLALFLITCSDLHPSGDLYPSIVCRDFFILSENMMIRIIPVRAEQQDHTVLLPHSLSKKFFEPH